MNGPPHRGWVGHSLLLFSIFALYLFLFRIIHGNASHADTVYTTIRHTHTTHQQLITLCQEKTRVHESALIPHLDILSYISPFASSLVASPDTAFLEHCHVHYFVSCVSPQLCVVYLFYHYHLLYATFLFCHIPPCNHVLAPRCARADFFIFHLIFHLSHSHPPLSGGGGGDGRASRPGPLPPRALLVCTHARMHARRFSADTSYIT
jgi:hypothetical protein